MKKIYLAGPMQGYKDFNFPTFHKAASYLRNLGYTVFSPAEKDIERHGGDLCAGTSGELKEIEDKGFSLRAALADDTNYICHHADALAFLPGWENSKGAFAEWSLARALGLEFIYLKPSDYD